MSKRNVWIAAGWVTIAAFLGWELVGAYDGNPNTVPLTDILVQYVPAQVTYALVAALIAWLPAHFHNRYDRYPEQPLSARKKHLAAVAVAVLTAVQAAISDDMVTATERNQIYAVAVGALLTYFLPNTPGAADAKTGTLS